MERVCDHFKLFPSHIEVELTVEVLGVTMLRRLRENTDEVNTPFVQKPRCPIMLKSNTTQNLTPPNTQERFI